MRPSTLRSYLRLILVATVSSGVLSPAYASSGFTKMLTPAYVQSRMEPLGILVQQLRQCGTPEKQLAAPTHYYEKMRAIYDDINKVKLSLFLLRPSEQDDVFKAFPEFRGAIASPLDVEKAFVKGANKVASSPPSAATCVAIRAQQAAALSEIAQDITLLNEAAGRIDSLKKRLATYAASAPRLTSGH
jgi:hypothetical protein